MNSCKVSQYPKLVKKMKILLFKSCNRSGCLFCGGKAVRNLAYMTKYYTPRYMHISNSYPGYLSGVVYLLRTDVIPLLLHMSVTTPIIHMDDAYVSGVLLRQLRIQPRDSPLFTYGRIDQDPCKWNQMVIV